LYGHGNIDYNRYGIGTVAGDAGLKLPLEQNGQVFRAEFSQVIKWRIFVGGRFWNGDSVVTLKPSSGSTSPVPPDIQRTRSTWYSGTEVRDDQTGKTQDIRCDHPDVVKEAANFCGY
jgi:hypothetical protein